MVGFLERNIDFNSQPGFALEGCFNRSLCPYQVSILITQFSHGAGLDFVVT